MRTVRARTLSAVPGTVLLLAALAALGQFASTVYIPSLPAVAASLGVSDGRAQLTLAVSLASLAAGQLVWGPFADRFGRRPVLFVGLGVFVVGTLACAVAPSLGVLLTSRAVQGIGAAAALVVSRAATRDSFEGPELARVLAAVTIAFALVPGLTPLLGGLTQQFGGWRSTFWLTLVVGGAVAVLASWRLPETLRRRSARLDLRSVASSYGVVLADRTFLSFAVAAGFAFASMSAFFAGSPAYLIGRLGLSPVEYGLYPPLAVTGFVVGGVLTRRLATEVAPRRLALTGLWIMLVGAVLVLVPPLFGFADKLLLSGAMVVHVAGLGLFLPTAVAGALQRFPDRAGTGAAAQGFLQVGIGALGAVGVSLLQPSLPLLAFPLVMIGATAIGLLVQATGPPGERPTRITSSPSTTAPYPPSPGAAR